MVTIVHNQSTLTIVIVITIIIMIINKENSIHEMRSGQIVKYCVKQIVRANEPVKV